MNNETQDHHVAWKDRIGLNDTWQKHILSCSELYGTDRYMNAVEGFRNSLIDIKDGPQLKQIVDDYYNTDMQTLKDQLIKEWEEENPQSSSNQAIYRRIEYEIDNIIMEKLYNYILQTLEDYGFCFYQSTIEEDEMQ